MSPQVEAALIAAGVGVLTVITTAFTQYLGRRATSKQLKQNAYGAAHPDAERAVRHGGRAAGG